MRMQLPVPRLARDASKYVKYVKGVVTRET